MSIEEGARHFRDVFGRLRDEIARVMVGQQETVDGALMCLAAGGHALLEGVPGLGKTLLVRSLASAIDAQFARIQFTPDLMPADVTGTNIIADTAAGREFRFQSGPVFTNILLADEINRATPKTQSALLEAMQERSVTVAGQLRPLPSPFLVLATQNPIEMEGTYPLPEAQLDRFMLKLLVRYPTEGELATILDRTTGLEEPQASAVTTGVEVLEIQRVVRAVVLAEHVKAFLLRIVLGTHPDNDRAHPDIRRFVRFGASPRGAQALAMAARVRALLDGRYNVSAEDVDAVAPQCLRHRVILNFEAEAERIEPDSVIAAAVESAREKEKLPA